MTLLMPLSQSHRHWDAARLSRLSTKTIYRTENLIASVVSSFRVAMSIMVDILRVMYVRQVTMPES